MKIIIFIRIPSGKWKLNKTKKLRFQKITIRNCATYVFGLFLVLQFILT